MMGMFWIEILTAFVVALALSSIFVGGFGWRRPGSQPEDGAIAALLFFFVIVFSVTWAGGGWVRPMGPAISGVSWLSFFVVGLLAALILAVANRPMRPLPPPEERRRAHWLAGVGLVFWLLLALLLTMVVTAAIVPRVVV